MNRITHNPGLTTHVRSKSSMPGLGTNLVAGSISYGFGGQRVSNVRVAERKVNHGSQREVICTADIVGERSHLQRGHCLKAHENLFEFGFLPCGS
jgi:hypothetical protein